MSSNFFFVLNSLNLSSLGLYTKLKLLGEFRDEFNAPYFMEYSVRLNPSFSISFESLPRAFEYLGEVLASASIASTALLHTFFLAFISVATFLEFPLILSKSLY